MTDSSEFPRLGGRHRGYNAILFDYDFINTADYDPDATCLYCLTNRQVAILQTILPYVGWKTRWESISGTPIDIDLIERLEADISAALVADVCSEIMTKLDDIKTELDTVKTNTDTIISKENDLHSLITAFRVDMDASQTLQDVAIAGLLSEMTAVIEPSIALLAASLAGVAAQTTTILSDVGAIGTDVNNIETVITDPTDGLAEVSADVDNIETIVGKLTNKVSTTINNTTITLNVTIPDQTFSSDSNDITAVQTYARYNALCQAVVDWILIEGWAMIDQLNGTTTDLNSVLVLIAQVAQNAIYAVQNPTAVGYTATIVTAAMVDSAAVNDVACAMISYLADLEPTSINFGAALNAYTPPAYPDNRKVIVDTLNIALGALNGYQVFTSLLKPEYDSALAANPTGFICAPCLPAGGCAVPATYDFTLGQKAPWLFLRGKLVIGTGLIGQTIPLDPSNYGYDVAMVFPTGCATLHGKGLKFTANHLNTGVGNAWTVEFWSIPTGGGAPTKYNTSSAGPTATYPALSTSGRIAIPTPTAGNVLYEIRWYTNTAYYGNATSQPCLASVLTKIEVVV